MMKLKRLKRIFQKQITFLLAMLLFVPFTGSSFKKHIPVSNLKKPNVIIFFIDDMGWTDLGSYGSDLYETPNIDKLADQGVRFTNAYAAANICSPSRAALMTGKYPARLHLTDWIAGHQRPYAKLSPPDWRQYLPVEETTIADVFKNNGYTTASIGKWHLGEDSIYYPQYQGFDVNIAGYNKGQPPSYFHPYEKGNNKLPYLSEGKEGEYLTDRLTDEALAFIEANKEKPFLLYFPHYAVHTPIQAKEELTDHYQQKVKPHSKHTNAKYAAMIHDVDVSVGRVMKALQESGIAENTLVIFTSDNGGLLSVTNNYPLRSGKGNGYEGGVRVPLIFKFPKNENAGKVVETPAITMDLFSTILSFAGIGEKEIKNADGIDLMPVLTGSSGKAKNRSLFWHYPHYHTAGATPHSTIRNGDFKLIEYYEDGKIELYNLKQDLGEQTDLAQKHSEIVERLKKKLHQWKKEVDAQNPVANPNYDPAKSDAKK